jgi:hypothetical protein
MNRIKQARELLAQPGKWTQGRNARDADGDAARVNDPEAVCFCLQGALIKCNVSFKEMCDIDLFCLRTRKMPLVTFNDSLSSVEPVLTLLDEYLCSIAQT